MGRFLARLSADPALAHRFRTNRVAVLAEADLDEEDRLAFAGIDDEDLAGLLLPSPEPPVAPEHPAGPRTTRWATPALALALCVAFVVFWGLFGGGR